MQSHSPGNGEEECARQGNGMNKAWKGRGRVIGLSGGNENLKGLVGWEKGLDLHRDTEI